MAEQLAESMGGSCEVKVIVGYPCLVNHGQLTEDCKSAAQQYLGSDLVYDIPIRMTSEGFSYFSQSADVCFYRLGVRNIDEGIVSAVHTPTFNIDESSLETAIGLMSYLTIDLLSA